MALNIPLPQAPDAAFGQSLDRGLNMYQALQNARLMREKLGLAQQQEQRAQELFPYQLEQQRRAVDPQAQIEYFQKLKDAYQKATGNTGGSLTDGQMISTPLGNMSMQDAMMLAGSGINIPGLQEQIKAQIDIGKTKGQEIAKTQVKEQADLGKTYEGIQSGLSQMGSIKQTMDNYQTEAQKKGYAPRYGVGAESITEPNILHRLLGATLQRVAHPLETLTHPSEIFSWTGGEGTKMHQKYLSELRGKLNQVLNEQAKNLNTRFTQKEYEILQANKPNISDTEIVLKGKLKAIEDALRSAEKKLKAQFAIGSQGSQPGEAAFLAAEMLPGEELGRQSAGVKDFVDPNNPANEYFFRDGKFMKKVKE